MSKNNFPEEKSITFKPKAIGEDWSPEKRGRALLSHIASQRAAA